LAVLPPVRQHCRVTARHFVAPAATAHGDIGAVALPGANIRAADRTSAAITFGYWPPPSGVGGSLTSISLEETSCTRSVIFDHSTTSCRILYNRLF